MENTKIAEYLLKIKAVRIQAQDPFTWSSGWKSPIYCDNRLALSYPEIRKEITKGFVAKIKSMYPGATAIAGVATGAIAWGIMVAEAMDLPFVYIRAKAKGHGLQNMIEGRLEQDKQYVVIEDLVSSGKSSVAAVKAMQEQGATVLGTLSIFSYGFPQADTTFATTATAYTPLTNLQALLQKATEIDYLAAHEQETIFDWQKDPEKWGR
ncbi:MAG: orotate phosphoribosyltransferase [Bacteroidia bacterium]